ncbi:hypothetical protein LZ32DRAFT_623744 [Colletotrichum eremochloae]|nr:hypothetical protein LZ32DRAFT_623744 [Colletotrichum eremochloae]
MLYLFNSQPQQCLATVRVVSDPWSIPDYIRFWLQTKAIFPSNCVNKMYTVPEASSSVCVGQMKRTEVCFQEEETYVHKCVEEGAIGGTSGKTFDELKRIACRHTDIRLSEITNDAPVVTSQRTLETTLAGLGIPADRVRSARRSRDQLAALVDCRAEDSVEQHGSRQGNTIDTPKRRSTANERQSAIDRIDSSIQRLNHQWQILDGAQKRLENLFVLISDEVDWDDPETRIKSEQALFDLEEE